MCIYVNFKDKIEWVKFTFVERKWISRFLIAKVFNLSNKIFFNCMQNSVLQKSTNYILLWFNILTFFKGFSKKLRLDTCFCLRGRLISNKIRYQSLLILLVSVAFIRRKGSKTTHTEERMTHTNSRSRIFPLRS